LLFLLSAGSLSGEHAPMAEVPTLPSLLTAPERGLTFSPLRHGWIKF